MRITNSDFEHVVRERSSAQDRRRYLRDESVGHRVTVFLVPGDKVIRGVAEAKQAAGIIIDNGSVLTAAPAERVRELSAVLRFVKAERAKNLHANEEDIA